MCLRTSPYVSELTTVWHTNTNAALSCGAFLLIALRGEDEFGTWDSALPYAFSYRTFVAVDGCGVDMAVSGLDGLYYSIYADFPVGSLECPESGGGDFVSVVEFHCSGILLYKYIVK